MTNKLGRYCNAILEAGWLGALVLVPLFFNVYSARVFEPDKLTLLRSIAVVMIIAWLVKVIDGQEWKKLNSQQPIWRFPMVLPVGILALVYLVTTAFSITPRVSLVGSYQRLQGTYTTLSYMVVFAMMLMHLRSKDQVDRLVTTAIIVSVPISLYGLVQKYGLDPLPWGGNVTNRIASNMGNAIFVSAYLIMITPLVISRVVESFTAILTDEDLSWADVIRASVYIFIIALQALAIIFSQSRGPMLGFLASIFIFVLVLLVRLRDSAPGQERFQAKDVLMALGSVLVAGLIGFGLLYLISLLATNQGWLSLDPASYSRRIKLTAEAFRPALLGAIGFVGALLGAVGGIFLLVATRRGWRWLWLSWILVAVLMGGFLVMFNVPNSPISDWRNLPYIGRLGTALDTQSNTGKVRTYIWQGVIEMIGPHEPLEFPDGHKDPFSALRPLIGYGPESMYVAYNSFYQPDLAHVEKRNASPDRSHNETFDTLVITGAAGFLAWQAVYGSLFYLGFHWLGVIRSKADRVWFFGLVLGIGAVSAISFWQWLGLEFIGVAFPFGELAGLLAYLAYHALLSKPVLAPGQDLREPQSNDLPTGRRAITPSFTLLTALLAAAVAHFAEIHFGIAIAATRTYFFAYAALAVVLGSVIMPQEALGREPDPIKQPGKEQARVSPGKRKRNSKGRRPATARAIAIASRPDWFTPLLVGGLIMGLALGALGYEFINNPQRPDAEFIPGTGQILWDSLTKNPKQDFAATYAGLGMLTLTLMVGCALVVSEASKKQQLQGSEWNTLKGIAVYLGSAISLGFIYMAFQAGRLRFLSMGAGALQEHSTLERIRIAANATAGLLASFYIFVFLTLLGLAWMLTRSQRGRPGRAGGRTSGNQAAWIALAVGVVAAVIIINTTNLDIIRADTVYKQADPWDKRAMREKNPNIWALAIAEYNHALELAPLEDFYYLWLGRAYLEQSTVMDDPVAQQQLMEVAKERLLQARQINPLNTDHSANLARLHTRWAELASSDVERTTKANQAHQYYEQANNLSPNNAVIINEWAMLIAGLFGDCDGGLEKLNESLEVDDQFANTYQNMGNVALTCGDRAEDEEQTQAYYEQAESAYLQQLELAPCNTQAHTALGYAQSRLGKTEQAIETNLAGIKCIANSTSRKTLQFHRNLTILYQQQGDPESALEHARNTALAAGNNVSSLLDAARLLASLGAVDDIYRVAQQMSTLEIKKWGQLRDLAVLFSQTGHPAEGLTFAQQALELAPDSKKQSVEELIATLQAQATP